MARRAAREPVAYILGHKGFLDHDFKVTRDTLIPRPETELLAEYLLDLNRDAGPREILDLGCGSGAILLSLLAGLPEARGLGVDISAGAVSVTLENAGRLGVEARCAVLVSDLFSNIPEDECFDVIVSNPPYIASSEIMALDPSVRDHEPVWALDGGEDGLKFYKGIIKYWRSVLKPGGLIFFEVGEGEAEAVRDMLLEGGFSEAEYRQDSGGTDRVVIGRLEE